MQILDLHFFHCFKIHLFRMTTKSKDYRTSIIILKILITKKMVPKMGLETNSLTLGYFWLCKAHMFICDYYIINYKLYR